MRFEDWLDQNWRDVGIVWADGLVAYRDVITEYYIYERGIEGLLWELGHRNIVLDKVGYKFKPIAPYWYDGIAEYFPKDVALYNEIVSSQPYPKHWTPAK
jgi:hypothetical protein